MSLIYYLVINYFKVKNNYYYINHNTNAIKKIRRL